MYDIIFYALIFLIIPLGCFFLFSWAILFHILKYGFHHSVSHKIALVFALVMVALSLFVVQKFFAVDWGSVSLKEFLDQSNLNFFMRTYGR